MRSLLLLPLLLLLALGGTWLHRAGASPEDAEDTQTERRARVAWVRACLDDLSKVKPGMTRAQVEKLYPHDGGLTDCETMRFVHPDCPYFKIDVTFDLTRAPDDDGEPGLRPTDLAVRVSKPYLERPFAD